MTKPMTYKDAGVDIDRGDAFVERIKKMVGPTLNKRVTSAVGGFASLYDMGDGRYLASGTDGVGTKLLLAHQLDSHETIGQDLVAMCVNDILCTGARPLFFLDYLATSALDLDRHEAVIKGIVGGCLQSGAALVGGETAEMPGLYAPGHYDLAGFAVGEVYQEDLLDGSKCKAGTTLIGVPSSGAHSNGYSLLRKLFQEDEREWLEKALIPTKIYVKEIFELQKKSPGAILGLAHITGGGFTNIARLSNTLDAVIKSPPPLDKIVPLFAEIKKRSGLGSFELYRTFNMGIGLVIATDRPKDVINFYEQKGETVFTLGEFAPGTGETKLLCPETQEWLVL